MTLHPVTRHRLHRLAQVLTVALFLAYFVVGRVAVAYRDVEIQTGIAWLLAAEAITVGVAVATRPKRVED